MTVEPPRTEAELLERARALAGVTVAQLAARLGIPAPGPSRRAKGYAGQLLEAALGATAGSASAPDFQNLGVELKSLPVNAAGRPRESTYVCTVTLLPGTEWAFETSCVRRKLARVLWFPVLSEPGEPVGDRRLGRATLWSPDAEQLGTLHADFEEHMEHIQLGHVGELTARHGVALQVRPKAASNRERTEAIGPDGRRFLTNPRGFYLRPGFTNEIIARSVR